MESEKRSNRPEELTGVENAAGNRYGLTPREAQILTMSGAGQTDKQIGLKLGISRDTVATYWRRIFAKVKASSRTEAIAKVSATVLSQQKTRFQVSDRTRRLLACLADPSLYGIASRKDAQIALELMLKRIIEIVGCEYGLIGEAVLEDGQLFLKTQALTVNSWNDETERLYQQHLLTGLEFRNLNTLFGAVITSRQTVIANETANDPRAAGVPNGHPDLRQFLGIPLLVDDMLVGMIGLANLDEGFSEDTAEFLAPVASVCSAIMLRLRSQKEKDQYLSAVSESQARLQLVLDEVSDAILFIDKDHRVGLTNAAFGELFGAHIESQMEVGTDCYDAATTLSKIFRDPDHFLHRVREDAMSGRAFEESLGLTDGRQVVRRFQPLYLEGDTDGYLWIYALAN